MIYVFIPLYLTCLKILNASRLSSQALVNGTSPLHFSNQFEMNVRKCNLSPDVFFALHYFLRNALFFHHPRCISFRWWMDGHTFLCLVFFSSWTNLIGSLTGWIYVCWIPGPVDVPSFSFFFLSGWCKSRNWVATMNERTCYLCYNISTEICFFLSSNKIYPSLDQHASWNCTPPHSLSFSTSGGNPTPSLEAEVREGISLDYRYQQVSVILCFLYWNCVFLYDNRSRVANYIV